MQEPGFRHRVFRNKFHAGKNSASTNECRIDVLFPVNRFLFESIRRDVKVGNVSQMNADVLRRLTAEYPGITSILRPFTACNFTILYLRKSATKSAQISEKMTDDYHEDAQAAVNSSESLPCRTGCKQ